MREMGDLVGHQRTADTRVIGPAGHPGLEEGTVEQQLTAAVEQVGQADRPVRPVEDVFLVDLQPRHPPAVSGQCVPGTGQVLLLRQQPQARGLPIRWRDGPSLVSAVHRDVLGWQGIRLNRR
jgi:hypothetical protein